MNRPRNWELTRRVHPRLRTLLKSLAVGLAGLLALFALLERSVHHVPSFYAQRAAGDRDRAGRAAADLERQLLALHGPTPTPYDWQLVFSEEQVNDWLTYQLPANFPQLLPVEFSDPRVACEPDRVLVACRYTGGPVSSVITLSLVVELADVPNTLAVRVDSLRAGLIPLPRQRIVDALAHSAAQADLPLQWAQAAGDPVALIPLGDVLSRSGEAEVVLRQVEVTSGEVRVTGQSAPPQRPAPDDDLP